MDPLTATTDVLACPNLIIHAPGSHHDWTACGRVATTLFVAQSLAGSNVNCKQCLFTSAVRDARALLLYAPDYAVHPGEVIAEMLEEMGMKQARIGHPEAWEDVQRKLFAECEAAGWDDAKANSFAEECAHLHEEVSEAFREWRLHKDFEIRFDENGKPSGIPIELADVLIGLFYNAELHGFSLMDAVELKHLYNLRRRYPNEGRQLHPSSDEVAS